MKTLVLLSGGMDSATLLAAAIDAKNGEVGALTIAYGQRHYIEVDRAEKVAKHYNASWDRFELHTQARESGIFDGSSQTDLNVPVPHGNYDEPSMKKTVVPNRNMILLAIAGAYAISHDYSVLAYAAHAGDHTIYPDCRPAFVGAMRSALQLCDWKTLELWTPFLHLTKTDIARKGLRLGVPYHLTWTCYEGGEVACDKCGSCSERLEAFRDAEAVDPIPYASS